ncbi:helix-turn-helix domain-containing protein [Parabacteroides merdae]|uniref:helix-turn-helix domain-containing protein n=1 Tax=Parabacteroides merdae TaxID=46503 RepID=UPI00210F1661|nr:helix-turn-helix domain-containing protein [Parabacteroides merdae]
MRKKERFVLGKRTFRSQKSKHFVLRIIYVLLEAKDLLIKTRLRSSRIAMMLNFSNYDTFARWFRRHTGELPGNWR